MNNEKNLQVSQKQPVDRQNGEPTRAGLLYTPEVDIFEDTEAITLRADLPGVRREDVDIDVRDGVLTLTASSTAVQERWRNVYSEYTLGGFSRRFSLGEALDPSQIKASIEDGVLTVVLPKAATHKPRRITIS